MIGTRPLGRWLVGQDPRTLCRRLDLEGWEHLVAADTDDGVLIEIAASGPWPTVAWAIAYYREGLDLIITEGDSSLARGLDAVGVRLCDRLPDRGRRAVVGRSDAADLRAVATGDRRGFRIAFTPTAGS